MHGQNDEAEETLPETIDARIKRGRETGSHADGAIIPFPPDCRGNAILDLLQGNERKKVDTWLTQKFVPTVYEYRSDKGEVIQAVVRLDHSSNPKEIRPLRYLGKSEGGGHLFWFTAIDAPRPLKNLDKIAARSSATVLWVEGESTASAAEVLFPKYVVTTSMSGASSVPKTELLALAGREVVIWPDNDAAGRKAGLTLAALAFKAGAKSVSFVDVPREFGEKWDLADDVPAEHRDAFPLEHLLATARPLSAAELKHLTSDARQKAEHGRLLGHKPGHSKVDVAAVKDALNELDPGMSRAEWLKVARCLYLAFGPRGL